MVESAIYFLIGFLAAALLALLAAPAISRRATRLAEVRARLQSPLSESQARADRDALRGQHAVEIVRMELRVRTVEEDRAASLAELGRRAAQIVRIDEVSAERAAEIGRQRAEIAALHSDARDANAQLGAYEIGLRDLVFQRDIAERELAQTQSRVTELETLVDENRAVIAALETRATRLDLEILDLRRAAAAATRVAEAERARLTASLAERAGAARTLGDELADAAARYKGLLVELEGRSAEAVGLRERLAQVEPRLAQSEAAREEFALENSRQLARIAERDAALKRARAEGAGLADRAELESQIEQLKARLSESSATIEAFAKGDQALRQSIARLGREIVRGHGAPAEDEPAAAQIVNFARREPPPPHPNEIGHALDRPIASEG